MPLEPPVTRATLPSNDLLCIAPPNPLDHRFCIFWIILSRIGFKKMRINYSGRTGDPLPVARMGMSTLHHFRALTAMSPLQYQEQLRLVAARERMLVEGLDAASAAFEVGMRVRVSSTARTSASSVNRRCGTSKCVGSPAPQWSATDTRADHSVRRVGNPSLTGLSTRELGAARALHNHGTGRKRAYSKALL
jgi:hypothetical protein